MRHIELTDKQWVEASGALTIILQTQAISGKLDRFFKHIIKKVEPLAEEFRTDFEEKLKENGSPQPGTQLHTDLYSEVMKTFETTSEFEIPEIFEEELDNLLFAPGHKDIIKPLLSNAI